MSEGRAVPENLPMAHRLRAAAQHGEFFFAGGVADGTFRKVPCAPVPISEVRLRNGKDVDWMHFTLGPMLDTYRVERWRVLGGDVWFYRLHESQGVEKPQRKRKRKRPSRRRSRR